MGRHKKTPHARDEGPLKLKEARGAQVSSEPPEPPIAFALLGAVALVQGDLALGELPVAAVTVRDDVQEVVVPVGIGGHLCALPRLMIDCRVR